MRDVLKGPVALVAEKLGRATLATYEQIDETIVIKVRPGSGLGCVAGGGETALTRNVGKSSIAMPLQERHTLGKLPSATQHQNVQAAVIVVIGLDQV